MHVETSIARLEELALAFNEELTQFHATFPKLRAELQGILAARVAELATENREANRRDVVEQAAAVRTELAAKVEKHVEEVTEDRREHLDAIRSEFDAKITFGLAEIKAIHKQRVELTDIKSTLKTFATIAADAAMKEYAAKANGDLPELIKREFAAMPAPKATGGTALLAECFKGQWEVGTSYARGDVFAFRGGCYVVLKPSLGIMPTKEELTGNSPRFGCLSSPGAPAPAGMSAQSAASAALSEQWATLTSSTVDGTSYSSKEYAQGTQAGTGGSAKNWAQQTGADVTGAATNSRSAKAWAQSVLTGATLGGSAKDWAQTLTTTVDGTYYSARQYALNAATITGCGSGDFGGTVPLIGVNSVTSLAGANLTLATGTYGVFATATSATGAVSFAANVTAPDYLLGTSGPSVKSSLGARGPRNGLVFDGTVVTASTTISALGTGDFAISLWVNPTSLTADRRVIYDSGEVFSLIVETTGRINAYNSGAVYGPSISVGKWSHVVVSRASGVVTVYTNAIAGTPGAQAGTINGTSWLLGSAGASYIWYGGLAAPYVENRAMSAAEVLSLYEQGVPPSADYNSASNTALVGAAFSNYLYDSGTIVSGATTTGFTAVETSSNGAQAIMASATTFLGVRPVGAKYRVQFTATLTSGSIPTIFLEQPAGSVCSVSTNVVAGLNTLEIALTVALTAESGTGSGQVKFQTSANTSYAISGFSIVPLGLLLAWDEPSMGAGSIISAAPGTSAVTTLPASGVTYAVPTSWTRPYTNLLAQSTTPAAPASGFVQFADSTGRNSWRRASDGFVRTWDATLTADRVYTLPDASGTVLLTTNVAAGVTTTGLNSITAAASTDLTLNAGTGSKSIILARAGTGSVEHVKVTGSLSGDSLFSHAFADQTAFTSTTDGGYSSYDSIPVFSGTIAYNHFYGFQARNDYEGSGVLSDMSGFTSATTAGGPISNHFGIRIKDPLGVGAITNNVGVYIYALTRGGTTNYAVQTAGSTKSLFGGNVGVGGVDPGTDAIYVNGTSRLTGNVRNDGRIFCLGAVHSTGNIADYPTNGGIVMAGNATTTAAQIKSYSDTGGTVKQLTISATTTAFDSTTNATTAAGTTGSIATLGGASIKLDTWVGGLLNVAGAATVLSITTGAPTTGTAGVWKTGIAVVSGTSTLLTDRFIQLDIGGTLYKLACVSNA